MKTAVGVVCDAYVHKNTLLSSRVRSNLARRP